MNNLQKLNELLEQWKEKYRKNMSIQSDDYTERMDRIENIIKGIELSITAISNVNPDHTSIRTTRMYISND